MIFFDAHQRHRNHVGASPKKIEFNFPDHRPPHWKDLLFALLVLVGIGFIFFIASKKTHPFTFHEDEIQVIETLPPPPQPKEIKELPKPTPPRPREVTPPPLANKPPPPQFGLEKEATTGNGDMAVATGNSLLKKADTVIKAAPPPPPPEPLQLDQEPEAMEKVVPVYPEWALEQGVTLRVLVLITIDASGKVMDVRIKKTDGKDFDKAALEAAGKTKYKPYVEKGKPLPARFVVAFEFVL